jgi:hypothetical protein
LAAANHALSLQPNLPLARGVADLAHRVMGMHDEVLAHLRMQYGADPELLAGLEQGLMEGGYQGAARAVATRLAARYEEADGAVPFFYGPGAISGFYVEAGDFDSAIDWLEEGYRVHNPNLPYHTLPGPGFDTLRDNPRFQDLLRRMNLPPYSEER